VVLLYHAVDERDGDPACELIPPISKERFRRQLRRLHRHHGLVPTSTLLSAVRTRHRGERFPVCVTFDDDLPQQARYAMPICRETNVPATFFLCGSALASPESFWWERLQRVVSRGQSLAEVADLLPEAVKANIDAGDMDIHEVAATIQALTPSERDDVSSELLALAGPDPPDSGLRRNDVTAIVEAGSDVGFHTRRHDDLRGLDDAQLERALQAGRSDLEDAAGRRIHSLAYPHGSADPRVADAAGRAGYELAFTADPIAVTPASNSLLVGRLTTDGMSNGELALRIAWMLLTAPSRVHDAA